MRALSMAALWLTVSACAAPKTHPPAGPRIVVSPFRGAPLHPGRRYRALVERRPRDPAFAERRRRWYAVASGESGRRVEAELEWIEDDPRLAAVAEGTPVATLFDVFAVEELFDPPIPGVIQFSDDVALVRLIALEPAPLRP